MYKIGGYRLPDTKYSYEILIIIITMIIDVTEHVSRMPFNPVVTDKALPILTPSLTRIILSPFACMAQLSNQTTGYMKMSM
jgi:hypothetical protein